MFTITIKGKAKAGDKAIAEVKALKTQSVVSYKEDLDDLSIINGDMKTMGLYEAEILKVVVDFKGAKASGRMVNRCMDHFTRIGIIVPEQLPWEQEGGKIIFEIRDMTGEDAYPLCWLLKGIVTRAGKKMSYTHHALTMYDIKQAVGLVWGASQGDAECLTISEWVDGYVAIAVANELEDRKAKQKKVKSAKAKAKKAEKATEATEEATGEKNDEATGEAAPLMVEEEDGD